MSTIEENVKRFEDLMAKVNRDGVDQLMDYIKKSDFYSAPASTRFHLSCEGGLLQHSLNVYDCLIAKASSPVWGPIIEKCSEESLIIMALLHDLCKTYYYVPSTKNQKVYDADKVNEARQRGEYIKHDQMGDFYWETVLAYSVEDKMPLGHGEKSVMLINRFMRLESDEIFAIRWHMGYTEDRSVYNAIGDAMEKHPIVLALYEADLEASKLIEDTTENKN